MSMETEYLLKKFSLKLQRSAVKYPFLADEKNREAVLQLLAETLMEDSETLKKLGSVGYDKVKDLMNSLLEGALRKIEEKIEKTKEELSKEHQIIRDNQKILNKNSLDMGKDLLDSIVLSHQNLREAIKEVKIAVEREGEETRDRISNISWLKDRSW